MERLGVQAGQTVAGKYRLEELLGHGGMGSVWRAEHLELLSPVAIKVLKPSVAENDNAMARFLREAKAAARLRSPHVVQILDHGQDGSVAYIAMELMEGESLLARLRRDGRLSPELTATIITHVGRAIGRAHDAGIIHRDLKPDNVFLVPNEDEVIAKVLDFGIAKSSLVELNATGSPQTQTGALLGTPYYMSPEQAAGEKSVDHRTDLWALGVIAFECLCGRRPFQSDALGDLVLQICVKPLPVPSSTSEVPAGFDGWFAKATARDPDERHQSARQMATELREALLGTAVTSGAHGSAPSPSGSDPTPRSGDAAPARNIHDGSGIHPLAARTLDPMSATTVPNKRRMVVGAAATLVALVLLTVGLVWTTGSGPPGVGPSGDGATTADPAEQPSTAERSDSAVPVDDPADGAAGDGAERGKAGTTAAAPQSPPTDEVPPRPTRPLPPPPPRRPPSPPPEEDPLGI